jgi:hypothetical protein
LIIYVNPDPLSASPSSRGFNRNNGARPEIVYVQVHFTSIRKGMEYGSFLKQESCRRAEVGTDAGKIAFRAGGAAMVHLSRGGKTPPGQQEMPAERQFLPSKIDLRKRSGQETVEWEEG